MQYDRTLLVADPRRCEPKKYALLPPLVICLHSVPHAAALCLSTDTQTQLFRLRRQDSDT